MYLPKHYRLASCAKAVIYNACIHRYMISYPPTLIAVFKGQVEQP
jgi:hypothetical protein